jgi:hypothetical protein
MGILCVVRVQKLFPALLNILTHKPPYPPRVQARTVAVYRRCGKGLYHLRFESKLDEGLREFLAPTLGPWMSIFGQLLDPVVLCAEDLRC